MEATHCLRKEHQVILNMLDCFELALREAHESATIDRETFASFLEFFHGFADRCHHCKEEDRLFPCLVKGGLPKDSGPIGVMLAEHKEARQLVALMENQLNDAASGNADAQKTLLGHGDDYISLLRAHIVKEDLVLFNMADDMVQGATLENLTRAYTEAENEEGYDDTLTRCRTIADHCLAHYPVTAPQS